MDELSKCLACGELDTIYHTDECGYCAECYAIENYKYVEVKDDREMENNS